MPHRRGRCGKKHEATREGDLFRSRLDQIINMKHELVQLAGKIDWAWIDTRSRRSTATRADPASRAASWSACCYSSTCSGCPTKASVRAGSTSVLPALHRRDVLPAHLPARALRPQPLEEAPGRQARDAAGREPAGGAPKRRAADQDLARVMVDTTVQPKNIAFPTDARLLHAAIKGLNRLARRYGVRLRQSYVRVARQAAMMAGRYAHAKQFNRHHREVRFLRTRLGLLIRHPPQDRRPPDHRSGLRGPAASQIRSQRAVPAMPQRNPHRCQLQLQAHSRLAQEPFAHHPVHLDRCPSSPNGTQSRFLTGN